MTLKEIFSLCSNIRQIARLSGLLLLDDHLTWIVSLALFKTPANFFPPPSYTPDVLILLPLPHHIT